MNKKKLCKIIFYFFLMPWRLMPTRFKCGECGKSIFFKSEVCGFCRMVIEWDDAKEYEHI